MPAAEQLRRGRVAPPPVPAVDPLEDGDLLTGAEFLRRYQIMPHVKKAELIEGVVYLGCPVRLLHAEPDTLTQTWLGVYSAHTPGTVAAGNATLRLDPDNVVQPGVLLRRSPACGGRSQVDADGYLAGPPELIVEIAASSASIDLRDKLRVYRRCGVREYLVWRTAENELDWFVLETDRYVTLQPDVEGFLKSRAFPGLWLPPEAARSRQAARVLEVLQAGLADPAHAAFVAQLAAVGQAHRE